VEPHEIEDRVKRLERLKAELADVNADRAVCTSERDPKGDPRQTFMERRAMALRAAIRELERGLVN